MAEHLQSTQAGEQFFAQMETAVRDWLVQAGYSVIRLESQDWAAHYLLSKENTGGTIDLFFGPMYEHGEGEGILNYAIVREEDSHESHVEIPAGAGAEKAASAFLAALAGQLTNDHIMVRVV